MKVVQIIDTLRSGGAERMAVNIHLTLEKKGLNPVLFVSRELGLLASGLTKSTGISVFKKKSFYDFKTFRLMYKKFGEIQPEVLHAHSTSLFWAVILKIFFPKVTLIWHDHYGLSDQLGPNSKRPERYFIRFIDGIITVNEKLNQWWQSTHKISERKISVISNFPFLTRKITRNNTPNNHFQILCLANFRRQKDHPTLINAIRKVCESSRFSFTLNLVGDLGLEPSYTQEVKSMVKSLGLEQQVVFHGASQYVEDFLEKADIGVLSSSSEGLPVSLLEYGLSGLPTIVTEVGDCETVLLGGELGKLIPPGSSDALALAIIEISSNFESEKYRASKLLAHVESAYGSEGFFNKYSTFIKQVR